MLDSTWASLVVQMVKNLLAMQETRFQSWVGKIPWSVWHGNPLRYYCLGNPMGTGAWWAIVHGIAKSQIGLNN